jgi:hypothetical protein
MGGEYIMDTMDFENYNSNWEKFLKTGLFNKEEVKELYNKNFIDFFEYKYAMEYFAYIERFLL